MINSTKLPEYLTSLVSGDSNPANFSTFRVDLRESLTDCCWWSTSHCLSPPRRWSPAVERRQIVPGILVLLEAPSSQPWDNIIIDDQLAATLHCHWPEMWPPLACWLSPCLAALGQRTPPACSSQGPAGRTRWTLSPPSLSSYWQMSSASGRLRWDVTLLRPISHPVINASLQLIFLNRRREEK